MAPVFLFLLFVSLTAVPLGAADDGDLIDEDDSVIETANAGTSGLIHGDIRPNWKRNADTCTAEGCKWPKRGRYVIVPVAISSTYTRAERNIIIRGLLTFHRSTCIRFVWRRLSHRSYLYFYSGSGCWSYLGRQDGGQRISLKKDLCLYSDTVQHEVLHALGFHHEHVRSDRDRYVSILSQNIRPGKEGNFRKEQTNNLGTPYDFSSIMHYSNYAFTKNRQPTIVARSNPNLVFGQATQMSTNDIARVNKLYRCY